MKKSLTALSLAIGICSSQFAMATPYTEVGDAGYSLATAQLLPGGTTSITGQQDGVDIYRFGWGGGAFTADTNGGAGYDTMLFVFNLAGSLLAFNDDSPFCCQSQIFTTLAAGEYLLAIDQYSYNYGGNLAGFAGAGSSPGGSGYTIFLGSQTTNVPEPASLALLGLGLAGLGLSRRKKQQAA